MKVIIPSKDLSIIASNIDYSLDPTEWSSSTAYSAGNQVRYGARKYQALASSTGVAPDSDLTKWADIGVTNHDAFLDDMIDSQSVSTAIDGSIQITAQGSGDFIALLGITGELVTIDGNPLQVIKDVEDWWEYYASEIEFLSEVSSSIVFRQPVTITIDRNGELPSKLGKLVIGRSYQIGDMNWNATASMTDYSVTEKDDFGYTQLVQRGYVKNISGSLEVPTSSATIIHNKIMALRATPAVWIEPVVNVMTYGFIRDAKLRLTNNVKSTIDIEIEGLL